MLPEDEGLLRNANGSASRKAHKRTLRKPAGTFEWVCVAFAVVAVWRICSHTEAHGVGTQREGRDSAKVTNLEQLSTRKQSSLEEGSKHPINAKCKPDGISRHTTACGVYTDCPMQYDLKSVNVSAQKWDLWDATSREAWRSVHHAAKKACAASMVQSTGGYCYHEPGSWVALSPTHRYYQPHCYNYSIDSVVAGQLLELLRQSPSSPQPYFSLNDFGAGVGQYGHALQTLDPRVRWRGWDGAGNVEEWTNGFVEWFDLTMPLSMPKADWVMSLEVAEHIPSTFEEVFIRNLHTHNCRGIVLSWAILGQGGHNHVNNHDNAYVISRFRELGYLYDEQLSDKFRHGPPVTGLAMVPNVDEWPWFRKSVLVFRRPVPVC